MTQREVMAQNALSKIGAGISHFFIYEGVGIAAFIFAYLVLLSGLFLFFDVQKNTLLRRWTWGLYYMILVCFASARFEGFFRFLAEPQDSK